MRRRIVLCAAALLLGALSAAAAEKTRVLTIDPMTELLFQFIGGPYVSIRRELGRQRPPARQPRRRDGRRERRAAALRARPGAVS